MVGHIALVRRGLHPRGYSFSRGYRLRRVSLSVSTACRVVSTCRSVGSGVGEHLYNWSHARYWDLYRGKLIKW